MVHVVARGQTLYRIAKTYGVSLDLIASANGISDPARIDVGQRLLIPGAARPLSVPTAAIQSTRVSPTPSQETWNWPVVGPITSRFGPRGSRGRHTGIDIVVPIGTPVAASLDGRVRFVGHQGNYGRLVILDHDGGFSSWYGHNSEALVREGQFVRQGEVIARSGRSGNATGPHLHFELRRDDRPLDPLVLLPGL